MLFRTGVVATKRLILIRHGESTWNEVFNQGILRLPFGLVMGIIKEVLCLLDPDSVFIDAPLNWVGIDQAKDLRRFLDRQTPDAPNAAHDAEQLRDLAALRGDPG